MSKQGGVEGKVREIRRKTRRKYSAEEKTRIVLEGLYIVRESGKERGCVPVNRYWTPDKTSSRLFG